VQTLLGLPIRKGKKSKICSTHEEEEKCIKDHLVISGVDWTIILKINPIETGRNVANWSDLAREWDKWWATVNLIINSCISSSPVCGFY
jgi:hypothetical protein